MATKIYKALHLDRIKLKLKNILGKIRRFLEKSIHVKDSDYPPNHRKSKCKKSSGNTIVRRFRQGI